MESELAKNRELQGSTTYYIHPITGLKVDKAWLTEWRRLAASGTQNQLMQPTRKLTNPLEEIQMGGGDGPLGYIGLPGQNEIRISSRELEQYFALASSASEAAASTMQSAFNAAWDDIFGHADSLLEQFLQSMAANLFSILANIASGGIFSGISSLLGLSRPVRQINQRRSEYV